MEEFMQNIRSWIVLISEKWWAIFTVYLSLFVLAYGGIWFWIEPLSIPDRIGFWNNQVIERPVVHIAASFLFASHITLLLGGISASQRDRKRRQELQQREQVLQKLNAEKIALETELKSHIDELERSILDAKSTSIRTELLRGMDNPSKSIEELERTRQKIAHLFEQIDAVDARMSTEVLTDTLVRDEREARVLQSTLSFVVTMVGPIIGILLVDLLNFAWLFSLFPEPIQLLLTYVGTGLFYFVGAIFFIVIVSLVAGMIIAIMDKISR
jgi:hypothetical protein